MHQRYAPLETDRRNQRERSKIGADDATAHIPFVSIASSNCELDLLGQDIGAVGDDAVDTQRQQRLHSSRGC